MSVSKINIPALGLGTYLSQNQESEDAVVIAIRDHGYRHIDTADIYNNHKDVGTGLARVFSSDTVKRCDVFVTTKLWMLDCPKDRVKKAVDRFLEELKLDYVDLLLMHWPVQMKIEDVISVYDDSYDIRETWAEMENLVSLGLVKWIGVSNFNEEEIKEVLSFCKIKPSMNQIEIHPYLPQFPLVDYCSQMGIKVTAYCPLGAPGLMESRSMSPQNTMTPLNDPIIKTLGVKYGKTSAQIILRWLVQRDIIVIPKSVNKTRIEENSMIFDFELNRDDMKTMNTITEGEGEQKMARVINPGFRKGGSRVFSDGLNRYLV